MIYTKTSLQLSSLERKITRSNTGEHQSLPHKAQHITSPQTFQGSSKKETFQYKTDNIITYSAN